MYYSVRYIPGMVTQLLKAIDRGGLCSQCIWKRSAGEAPFSIELRAFGNPTLQRMPLYTIVVVPTEGVLYLHDGKDDCHENLIVENHLLSDLLRGIAITQNGGVGVLVDFHHKQARKESPVPVAHCAADFPWAFLHDRARRMLVSLKGENVPGFRPSETEYFATELALYNDDAERLARAAVTCDSLLFACQGARLECIRHLLQIGIELPQDAYEALVAHSLQRTLAPACVVTMLGNSSVTPSADSVQKMARAFSRTQFKLVYDALARSGSSLK